MASPTSGPEKPAPTFNQQTRQAKSLGGQQVMMSTRGRATAKKKVVIDSSDDEELHDAESSVSHHSQADRMLELMEQMERRATAAEERAAAAEERAAAREERLLDLLTQNQNGGGQARVTAMLPYPEPLKKRTGIEERVLDDFFRSVERYAAQTNTESAQVLPDCLTGEAKIVYLSFPEEVRNDYVQMKNSLKIDRKSVV